MKTGTRTVVGATGRSGSLENLPRLVDELHLLARVAVGADVAGGRRLKAMGWAKCRATMASPRAQAWRLLAQILDAADPGPGDGLEARGHHPAQPRRRRAGA